MRETEINVSVSGSKPGPFPARWLVQFASRHRAVWLCVGGKPAVSSAHSTRIPRPTSQSCLHWRRSRHHLAVHVYDTVHGPSTCNSVTFSHSHKHAHGWVLSRWKACISLSTLVRLLCRVKTHILSVTHQRAAYNWHPLYDPVCLTSLFWMFMQVGSCLQKPNSGLVGAHFLHSYCTFCRPLNKQVQLQIVHTGQLNRDQRCIKSSAFKYKYQVLHVWQGPTDLWIVHFHNIL